MANFPSRSQQRLWFAILPLLAALGCGGTGGSGTVVSGKVTHKGDPVSAQMKFIGAGNKEWPAPIMPDGSYTVSDLPLGDYTITLKGLAATGPSATLPTDKLPDLPGGKATGPGKTVQPPPKYATPDSGLKYTVKAGKQTHNIELE